MRFPRAALVGLAIAASTALAAAARAQEQSVPPSSYYTSEARSSQPLPDPFAILDEDGSNFSVPLPGGGDIQVQGPASEPPRTMPPIETWAVRRNTPFSAGGTPLGPAPAQP